MFDDYWEWVLREYPDFATYLGDHRYDDRLHDESAAAVGRRNVATAEFRERSARIDATQLSPADRTSLRVLQFRLERDLAITGLHGSLPFGVFDGWAPVTQMGGIHLDLPQLANATRFESVRDYDAYLKRLNAVPDSVEQLIARMQIAIGAGWMPPRIAVSGVPKQLEAQLGPDPRQSPEYQPFKSFPKDIATAEQERLAAAGRHVIQDRVIPAFQSLKTFYETRYLPAAPERIGASNLPAGLPYYQAWLDWNTTTDMTPQQIRDLGLQEVARIGAQMDAIVATTGFKGSRAEFRRFIATDPQFFYTKPQDMLAGYRDIAKRADAELPKLFAELPRQQYGIRAMRPEEGNNAEHYTGGAPDGSRAGWFEANVNDLKSRPKWTMETLLLHEAVPGHHLQTARAQELGNLPRFRRHTWFTAYGEGWALYAESLGDEMGFYKDPYQKFGNLSFEMLRACRLVVDTGLHAYGWTRQRAIDYMVDNTALTREEVTAEVDRYIVWPGQATAYKLGELRIKALRARAKAELGDRFDLRRFHNAVIDSGTVPLQVLDLQIDEWIASEKAALR
ncbi:MAG TPA: DUF885 domain-containing protein [Burkholderiaceae bacterium]|nr:DUF885 domain-containing protein [Burkholderiaceae bacterium]